MNGSGVGLPGSFFQPLTDLWQAIRSPERFAVNNDIWRAENAPLDCRIDFRFQPFLDGGVIDCLRDDILVVSQFGRNVGGDFRIGDVAVFDEISAVKGLGERFCCIGIPVVQPVKCPVRCLAWNRDWLGIRKGNSNQRAERLRSCTA